MILALSPSPFFTADFDLQIAWYVERAGEHVARRYAESVVHTLGRLCENSGIGARCDFKHPKLTMLRFCPVARPFQKPIVFYRFDDQNLFAERVMHGSRDLPNRLQEPPAAD